MFNFSSVSPDSRSAAVPASASETPLMSLYRQALGPVGVERNIRVFSVFEATGRTRPGWNWVAAFFTLHWMVFYRLWRPAALYASLSVLLFGLFWAVDAATMPTLASLRWWLLLVLGVVGTVVPGLYGDTLLYAQTELRVHNAIADAKTLAQTNTLLAQRAGNLRHIGWQALGHLLLLAVGSMVMIVGGVPDAPPLTRSKEPEATMATPIAPITSSTLAEIVPQPLPISPILPLNAAPAPTPTPAPTPIAPRLSTPIGDAIPATPTAPAPAPKPLAPASDVVTVPPQQKIINQPPAAPPRPPVEAAPVETEEPAITYAAPLRHRPGKVAVNPATEPQQSVEPPRPRAKVYSSRDAGQPTVQLPTIQFVPPPTSSPAPALSKTPGKIAVKAAEPTTKPEATPPVRAEKTAERLEKPSKATGRFFIHAGTFSVASNAEKVRARIEKIGLPVLLQNLTDGDKPYIRVRVGPFGTRAEVDSAAARLRLMGLDAMIYGR